MRDGERLRTAAHLPPANPYLRFGAPIRFAEPPEAADDQAVVDRLIGAVQAALQDLMDDTCARRRGVYCSTYDEERR